MDIERAVREYESGISSVRISEWANIPAATVIGRLRKAGVSIRSNKINSVKFSVNHNYFQDIDSVEKAYWLGLMFADGYVSGNKMGCSLSTKDHDSLVSFSNALEYTGEIKSYKGRTTYGPVEYSRLLITSDKLVEDLISHGCLRRKSLILTNPVDVPDEFNGAFISGYIDGDGSWAHAKGAKTGLRLKIIGTKDMLLWIRDCIGQDHSIYQYKNKPYIYQVEFRVDEDLVGYLYDGVSGMQRKHDRFLHAQRILSRVACGCSELCTVE